METPPASPASPNPAATDATDATGATTAPARPRALVGWRLLALFYDLWPAMAMWFLLSALFAVAHTLAGHDARDNIAPFSALQVLLWLCCWLVTGAYAMAVGSPGTELEFAL